ncbi:MAG: four helix bundle protein [Bacteroidia bacterium]|nr:four helix bundle protein [Bacteroidia bacterium]
MAKSIIQEKTFQFSLKIINTYQNLKTAKEFDLGRQLLRSGTSIGANVVEGKHAQSTLDFIHKLSIAQKEAAETEYWILLLKESNIIPHENADLLLIDCVEIQKIIAAIITTLKKKSNK